MINNQLDAEWWAEYEYVTDFSTAPPKIRYTRTAVLRFKGINGGRFMFEIYPTKLWKLYGEKEVAQRHQRGMLLPLVIKGGKA